MSNWEQKEVDQWNKEHSDYSDSEEAYSDEDDYAPLQMTSWGTQTVAEDGTTNVSLTVSGWASLVDPNFKVKENGIGSGQLHRKGAHYIPVDEQAIINRRLGKPVPKGSLGPSKKKSKFRPKPKSKGFPPSSGFLVPPSSSALRSREAITSGPWSSAQLSSTPFWELPAGSATNGTYASKYAAPPPQATQTKNTTPTRPPVNTNTPSYTQPVRPATQTATTTGFQRSSAGSAASKYATPSYAQEVKRADHSQSKYSQPSSPPQPKPAQPAAAQPPVIYHKLDTPVVNFDIELSPGVNAKLSVYENDIPEEVVNLFEKKHHLVMSEDAKRVFADKIRNLLQQYKPQ